MKEKNVTNVRRGLHKDNSEVDRPEGTYTYALNGVNTSLEGNQSFLSVEEGNKELFNLTPGYTPLGKVYIGDSEIAILSTNGVLDEIGVVDEDGNYTAHVNTDLGFKISHQIDLTYRLRGGCNKTIYWVDGDNNPPMSYDFGNPNDFKTNGNWDKTKFSLESSYSVYPEFTEIEVLDGGGSILPGSYNVGIMYVDQNLNSTPVITTSSVVNIYNDSIGANYSEVEGSVTSAMNAFDFGLTNKAIKVVSLVDPSYAYYRLCFIPANSGNGTVGQAMYTDTIPTTNDTFIFTGSNYTTTGTLEDVLLGGKQIGFADSIEQIDNRLVLANTGGSSNDLCVLQQFASKIQSDLVIKEVLGNSVAPGNPKSPTNHLEAVGYMPGEIYSFGIVYIFEDNTESPVYHIPGKSSKDADTVYQPGPNVYGMSTNNASENRIYINNDTCSSGDYWGTDSHGDQLAGTKVRHHRFPYRTDINVPMVTKTASDTVTTNITTVVLIGSGTIDTPCSADDHSNGLCPVVQTADPFSVRVELLVNGTQQYFYTTIDPSVYDISNSTVDIDITELSSPYNSSTVSIVKIEEEDASGNYVEVLPNTTSPKGMEYSSDIEVEEYSKTKNDYILNVYGIKFSNINLSALNAVSDKRVVGYHIVRNERKESDKTILDSAILTPCVNSVTGAKYLWGRNDSDNTQEAPKSGNTEGLNQNFLANGLLSPVFDTNQIHETYSDGPLVISNVVTSQLYTFQPSKRISKEFFGVVNPEHLFNEKKYKGFDRIKQEGEFNVDSRKYDTFVYTDVFPGTTYDPDVHRKAFKDDDGHMMRGGIRDSILSFNLNTESVYDFSQSDISDLSYLNAVDDKNYQDLSENVWNLSGDNRTGILRRTNPVKEILLNKFPYVYFEKDIADPYPAFRLDPYYKVSTNIESDSEIDVFEGDVYISPMRYYSSPFIEDQAAYRVGKNGTWKIILGGLIAAASVVLAFFTAGATLAAIGPALSLINSGVDTNKLSQAYSIEYGRGLKECLIDADTFQGFKYYSPIDDEVQWFGEVLTDVWFESAVNISLRHDTTESSEKFFMDSPGVPQGSSFMKFNGFEYTTWGVNKKLHLSKKATTHPSADTSRHLRDKILVDDNSRNSGKKYIGHVKGELYKLNPDYDRMNKQKVFFHLGVEYDCCSECQEGFPHRVWYSEQAFQEELSDNFKIFLPNNYRDIDGETGRITDLFVLNNNLYIHTEEALWHLPQNYQERVTDQLTTYIGTGEFFSIPPRKELDDEQNSGGTQHKWATNKNRHGIFFMTERGRKFYKFDGRLRDITGGLSKWFNKNIPLHQDLPSLSNNPSNPSGSGFISIYDSEKERVIFTKKDFSLLDGELSHNENGYFIPDPSICAPGYTYDPEAHTCSKVITVPKQPSGESVEAVTNGNASHGFSGPALYSEYNSNGTANVDANSSTGYTYQTLSEGWWVGNGSIPDRYLNKLSKWSPSFSNDVWYGGSSIVNVEESKTYYVAIAADNFFRFSVDGNVLLESAPYAMDPQHGRNGGTSAFIKLHIYPISLEAGCRLITVEGMNSENAGLFAASILDNTESEIIQATSQGDLNEIFTTEGAVSLYEEGFTQACPPGSESLGEDLCDLCLLTDVIEGEYIDIRESEDFVDRSWTISYDPTAPQDGSWVSWHSYLPRFYYRNNNKFSSWNGTQGNNTFWEHGVIGSYRNFYGEGKPFIVEYVAMSEPLKTKIWEDIILHTEAKRYNPNLQEFSDVRNVTFNKGIFYNTRQCTGELEFKVKDANADLENYMTQQVVNVDPGTLIIDRNERNWSLNDLRDIRVDYNAPIFDSNPSNLQNDYYADKILNVSSLDENKEWSQQESLRDKYLVVRLIFDTFEDVKLVMNYSIENETDSLR